MRLQAAGVNKVETSPQPTGEIWRNTLGEGTSESTETGNGKIGICDISPPLVCSQRKSALDVMKTKLPPASVIGLRLQNRDVRMTTIYYAALGYTGSHPILGYITGLRKGGKVRAMVIGRGPTSVL